MNTEHVNQWVEGLRTTDAGQCQGTLARAEGEGWNYCCLGLGESIRLEREPTGELRSVSLRGLTGTADHDPVFSHALPTIAFHEWLGLTVDDYLTEHDTLDVHVDWPRVDQTWVGEWPELVRMYEGTHGLIMQGTPHSDRHTYFERLSCADLNDDMGLTFDQIADVIAYFGVTS